MNPNGCTLRVQHSRSRHRLGGAERLCAGNHPQGAVGRVYEAAGRARRTSLVRFEPGAVVPEPVTHNLAEEVYLISGDLVVGCDAKRNGGGSFPPRTQAIRSSGVHHRPFTSRGGCVVVEPHYFED